MVEQRSFNPLPVLTLLLLASRCCSAYMIYRVGDDDGWTSNANGVVDYSKWASQKVFSVGDMLVFAFSSTNYSVLQTGSKDAFDSCNTLVSDAQIWSADGVTSANVLLSKPGATFFLCSEGELCKAGMKFGINVLDTPGSNAFMPPTAAPSTGSSGAPAPIAELTPPVVNTPGGSASDSSSSSSSTTTPSIITRPSAGSRASVPLFSLVFGASLLLSFFF